MLTSRDFLSGPVAKTPSPQCKGPRFDPWPLQYSCQKKKKMSWTELDGLQSMGSQSWTLLSTHMHRELDPHATTKSSHVTTKDPATKITDLVCCH